MVNMNEVNSVNVNEIKMCRTIGVVIAVKT